MAFFEPATMQSNRLKSLLEGQGESEDQMPGGGQEPQDQPFKEELTDEDFDINKLRNQRQTDLEQKLAQFQRQAMPPEEVK